MTTAKVSGVAFERRGAGEPLLLIHGTGGSRSHWKPVVDLLAPHRELLLVDLPGHGESDPPSNGIPHTPIGYARALAQLLDELGIESAHTAGNSVGGWTALELAKLARARSVVALSPAGLWPKRDPWRCTMQLSSQHRLGRLFAPLVPHIMRSDLGRTILLSGTMQIESIVSDGIQVLVPPDGGLRKDIRPGWDKGMYSFMRRVLASEHGHALYKHRKATVEPVFAQIKFNRKINRFQRRGRSAALSEWRLVAATHNLLKLHGHWIGAETG